MFFRKTKTYPDYLYISDHQIEIDKKFRELKPGDPFAPWTKRTVIPAAGVYASGWTAKSKVFLMSTSGYSVSEPDSGERILRNYEDDDKAQKIISKDNLEFYIEELNEKINIFGLSGGDGNHCSSDGLGADKIYTNVLQCGNRNKETIRSQKR